MRPSWSPQPDDNATPASRQAPRYDFEQSASGEGADYTPDHHEASTHDDSPNTDDSSSEACRDGRQAGAKGTRAGSAKAGPHICCAVRHYQGLRVSLGP